MSGNVITAGDPRSRRRFVGTVMVFALVGPVISGAIPYLTFIAWILLEGTINGIATGIGVFGYISAVVPSLAATIITGMLFEIVLHIAPAVVAGLVVATWEHVRGRPGVWLPIAAGLLAGILCVPIYLRLLGRPLSLENLFYSFTAISVVTGSALAAVSCWWLIRPRKRALP